MNKYLVFRKKDKEFERCFDTKREAEFYIHFNPVDYVIVEVEI